MASSAIAVQQADVVSHSEWLEARMEFLAKEREFTHLRDELSRQRRTLPWERVEKRYEFDSANGKVALSHLFDGRSQLMVYHFMLGPGWEQGCPSCSFFADQFDGTTIHLANRDVTLVVVSHAPLAEIARFKARMGWKFQWVSSYESDFNFDYHVSFTPEEMKSGKVDYNYAEGAFPSEEAPGMSVFAKDAAGEVFHTYSAYARGLDILNGTYNLLDLVPKGRDEDRLAFTMSWVRHHDRYEQNYSVDSALKPEELFARYGKEKSAGGSCCLGEGRS
ncbi:putative dithiol-disulfide oxidoreductase (DUF899 family) [Granulicella aggregans]|uniref:Putative dithiol-disulfide oxidoreductase (DUF899 family) n=1 Tax=Granulicella aggregans TaxID=474949 RepID=A0A7W7ZC09_9BACT|nr:thioredoxin family protein [Granulicella aggregans]MBB5057038.1 putative dithiol-disulfide oxidoreductase (DUF899 family) [Granulicella aggregans]